MFFCEHQDWNTLRDGPAPYKPDRADDMSELLESIKTIATTDPSLPVVVKRIISNFDDFEEARKGNRMPLSSC